MQRPIKFISAEYFNYSQPEKRLLGAMLELAVRDLINGSFNEIKSSLAWFDGEEVDRDEMLPFEDVADYLGLGAGETRKLDMLRADAEARRDSILKKCVVGEATKNQKSIDVDFNDITCKRAKDGRVVRRFRKGRTLAA